MNILNALTEIIEDNTWPEEKQVAKTEARVAGQQQAAQAIIDFFKEKGLIID